MNPEKLPQNQDKYNFDDLLPAEQSPEQDVDTGLDQLEAKMTAAENHHKNEVESQDRNAKLESARQQLARAAAEGASPTQLLANAKSHVVTIPARNKYGIVAMADTPKAKAAETEPATTTEEAKAGEAEPDSEAAAPTQPQEKKSWLRHPVQRFRQEADKAIPSDEELDARKEAAKKAAEEAAERDKGLIDADENPTRFVKPPKQSRAERKQLAANTRAAQAAQQERETKARKEGRSAADAIPDMADVKVPTVVKVEAPDPDEEKAEPEAAKTAPKAAAKPVAKAAAPSTPPESTTSTSGPTPVAVKTAAVPQTAAERSAQIAEYRKKAREAAMASAAGTDTDTEATGGEPAESSTVLSSTVPGQRAPETAKPVAGSGEDGSVTLDDLDDLDKILGEQPAATVTEEADGEADPDKTQEISTVGEGGDSSMDILEGALSRGSEAGEEEGENPERTGRMRRMGRAIGATATRFMDSRLMTGRWRDASDEARQERQAREDDARRIRRQRQLARDTDDDETAPLLGTVEAGGNPDDPDGGNDDEENASAATGSDKAKKNEPENGDGGNPDDPDKNTDEEGNPERRRRSPSRRTRRLAGLALAGSLLVGGAAASAEFAPAPHGVSASEQGNDQVKDNKSTEKHESTDQKGTDAGAEAGGTTGGSSRDVDLPPKGGNTVTTPGTTQNETDTVEKKSDTDVVVTLKQGGTIYQSGIDAGLNAAEVMNAVNNAHITDAMARGVQVGQQIDFHKSDNGEWTVKLR